MGKRDDELSDEEYLARTGRTRHDQALISRGRAKWGDCYMGWPSDWKEQIGGKSERILTPEELKKKISALEGELKSKKAIERKVVELERKADALEKQLKDKEEFKHKVADMEKKIRISRPIGIKKYLRKKERLVHDKSATIR